MSVTSGMASGACAVARRPGLERSCISMAIGFGE
jgi:hypothetical protein